MSKSELDIANEVMKGKWGTGKDRETRIRKAGYDYNIVQAYVNRMVETGKPIKEIEINPSEISGLIVNIKYKE